MPSACSSRDPLKCGMVPLLGTPNVAWSGLAFNQATNCLKSLTSAGTAVPTKTQNSKRASWLTGTKSFAASKLGVVSTIGSRYIVGPVVTRMVVPSGLADFAALIPISPSPPVRFSTMILRSSGWLMFCASTRQSASPPPPAANGKMIFVSGPDCADAWPDIASSAHAALPLRNSRRFIPVLRNQFSTASARSGSNPASDQGHLDNGPDADGNRNGSHRCLQAVIGKGKPARRDRQRHRNQRRQCAHSDHRAYSEQRDVTQSDRGAGRLRYRQHQKCGGAGHAVHQADQQGAPAKTVSMGMDGADVRGDFAGMAVGMEMHRAVAMAMPVKMHAVAPQPPQHVAAEADQHDADGGLDRPGQALRDGAAEQQG